MFLENYREQALKNEEIFRKILKDLKFHKHNRPMGAYIPDDLDTKSSIDNILTKYSQKTRKQTFQILDFFVDKDKAHISFEKNKNNSGGGAELIYNINDNKIKYQGSEWIMTI